MRFCTAVGQASSHTARGIGPSTMERSSCLAGRVGIAMERGTAYFPRFASRLHGPAPAADTYSQTKQQTAGVMPLFMIGQKPCGAKNCKYATAISPDSRKATGRVNRPTRSKGPPTVSRTPAIQASDHNGAVAPLGGMPIGKAKSFIEPARRKMNARKILSTLRRRGAQADHFATT